MRLLFPFMTLALAFPLREAAAQSSWYARDRWQLELATGSVIFECQLRGRTGDDLLVVEADSVREIRIVPDGA
jgi:hypothetical protein